MAPARPATGPQRPDGIDELILPYMPANVKPGGNVRVEGVTNDLYNIANRLKELNPRLAINITEVLDPDNNAKVVQKAYTIVEETPVGPEVVFRCNVLDGRVVEHVRYLLGVPFSQRLKEAERLMEEDEANYKENELNDMAERFGLPMLRELRECGFLGEYGKPDVARSRRRAGAGFVG